jgi:hypothetical protein
LTTTAPSQLTPQTTTAITSPFTVILATPDTAALTTTQTITETEPTPEPETTADIPPTGGDLLAFNGKVKVHFPAGAVDETIEVTVRRPKEEKEQKDKEQNDKQLPPYFLSGEPIEIVAFKKNGKGPVNKFKKAITIEVFCN